jgi:hypothetical protein
VAFVELVPPLLVTENSTVDRSSALSLEIETPSEPSSKCEPFMADCCSWLP